MTREPAGELERKAAEANVAYEENILLRVFVTLIPGIGGATDLVLAGEGQRIFKERMVRLFESVKEQAEGIEERMIDKQYIESEEYFDLLIKAFDTAAKTRSRDKIQLCARILANSAVHAARERYSVEEYLHLISSLTPQELRVSRLLYDGQPQVNDEAWSAWVAQTCEKTRIDQRDLPMMLNRLESSGLLERVTHDGTWGTVLNPMEPRFRVTPSFEKLMEFLGLAA